MLASWMGGADRRGRRGILNQAGIPTFAYPDAAARVLYVALQLQSARLYETPAALDKADADSPARARDDRPTRERPRRRRTLFTGVGIETILAAYGIPTVTTRSPNSRRCRRSRRSPGSQLS